MNDIKVGSVVKLLYWKDKKVHDFTITDIYFEQYISGFKTIVKAKYYSEDAECWFMETFFSNDFFELLRNNKKETTFDDYFKEQLKDPEFRKAWEKLRDDEQNKGGVE